jgi:hypothetical protein
MAAWERDARAAKGGAGSPLPAAASAAAPIHWGRWIAAGMALALLPDGGQRTARPTGA